MMRLFLVPSFFLVMYYYFVGYAWMLGWARVLLVFIVFSDFLDGYLARTRGEITALGSVLDPMADKLFVTASFVLLAVFDQIPAWLAIVVVTKDILVSVGWCALAVLYGKIEVNPSLIGKAATGFQYLTVCVIVLLPAGIPLAPLEYLTAVLTVFALIHYVYQGLQHSNGQTYHENATEKEGRTSNP